MKEAIGNSYLVTISITLLFLMMAILVASLSYSKAYKVKNKIISVIEKYDGYTSAAEADIYADLQAMGYRINTTSRTCPDLANKTIVHNNTAGKYDYCLYRVDSSRGFYFHVIAYMHFDIPFIGHYINLRVNGDSRTVYQNLRG